MENLPINDLEYYGDKVSSLGHGTFGTVYKCKNTYNKCVAVKSFKYYDGVTSDSLREIGILNRYRHPNIVKLIDVSISNGRLNMIMDLYSMSLGNYIKNTTKSASQLNESWMYQLSKGLYYLHHNNVWHRDIKPDNILIDDTGKIVLADLGLGRFGAIPGNMYTSEVVTLPYRAPEIFLGSKTYGPEIDVFSLGVVFIEMFTMERLFYGKEDEILLVQIKILGHMTDKYWPGISSMPQYTRLLKIYSEKRTEGTIDSILKPYSLGHGLELFKKMTYPNPSKRIEILEVINSKYFDKIKSIVNESVNFPKISEVPCGDNFKDDIIFVTLPDEIFGYPLNTLNVIYQWMLDVNYKYLFKPETVFYARMLMDIYLDNKIKQNLNVVKKELQGIGITAMMISAKIFEITSPDIESFADITDNTYSIKELERYELDILKTIKFNIVFPTVSEFLYYYTKGLSVKTKYLATNLALAYNTIGSRPMIPDKIARISVFIAIKYSDDESSENLLCMNFDKDIEVYADDFIKIIKLVMESENYHKIKIQEILNTWNQNNNAKKQVKIHTEGPKTPIRNNKHIDQKEISLVVAPVELLITRADINDVSRESVSDFMSEVLSRTAVKAIETFRKHGVSENNVIIFGNYFHLERSSDGKYFVSTVKPNRIVFNVGPMTVKTYVTLLFNSVPNNLVELFKQFIEMIHGDYENKTMKAKIYKTSKITVFDN